MARQPIPLMVLARLAVAMEHQGQGLGAALLKDAIGRNLAAAEIADI
ncbi:MAG: GNAT family N-acetyltransferase [Cyanobium sp.]